MAVWFDCVVYGQVVSSQATASLELLVSGGLSGWSGTLVEQ